MLQISPNTRNTSYKDLDIEQVTWASIRERVLRLNPNLAEVIDEINPSKKHPFFIASYPYGAKIVDSGCFYLPLKQGDLVSSLDSKIPESIATRVCYADIPLCLTLSNSNEVFVETEQRVVPLNFFHPGDLFGVFEVMNQITKIHSKPAWSITAGARTTFLLPRISDAMGHNRMRKEFHISAEPPKNLFAHYDIFRQIAANAKNNTWKNEILIFPKEWFEDDGHMSTKLYKFLLTLCWQQLQLFRDTIESNLRWSSFAEEMGSRNMKPRPYLVDMVKHLISITYGGTVAFIPTTDSSALPVDIVQPAYTNIYKLENYLPTIIQPIKFNSHTQPVYCSLSLSTVLDSSSYYRNAPSIIEDARDLRNLMRIFVEAIYRRHIISKDDPIICTDYDFFHTEEDMNFQINEGRKIVAQDKRFYAFSDRFKDKVPCENSTFFRGCIRIKRKTYE